MQEFPTSRSWMEVGLTTLLLFLGGGLFKIVTILLNWKKPRAEIAETDARTELTRAEARKINLESDSAVSDLVLRITGRLAELNVETSRLTHERDTWKHTAAQLQVEVNLNEKQIRHMKALLDLHQIKYSELDEPRA